METITETETFKAECRASCEQAYFMEGLDDDFMESIETVLQKESQGVPLDGFGMLYKSYTGHKLDFKQRGFSSLRELLEALPGVAKLVFDKKVDSFRIYPANPQLVTTAEVRSTAEQEWDSDEELHRKAKKPSDRPSSSSHNQKLASAFDLLPAGIWDVPGRQKSIASDSESEHSSMKDNDDANKRKLKRPYVEKRYWELYVANFLDDTSEAEMREEFQDYCCTEVRLVTLPDKEHPIAFVRFKRLEDARNALLKDGSEWNGRTLRIAWSRDSERKLEDFKERVRTAGVTSTEDLEALENLAVRRPSGRMAGTGPTRERSCHISNFPAGTTKEELRDLLKGFGCIRVEFLIQDPNETPIACAVFASYNELETAILSNDETMWKGKCLNIVMSPESKEIEDQLRQHPNNRRCGEIPSRPQTSESKNNHGVRETQPQQRPVAEHERRRRYTYVQIYSRLDAEICGETEGIRYDKSQIDQFVLRNILIPEKCLNTPASKSSFTNLLTTSTPDNAAAECRSNSFPTAVIVPVLVAEADELISEQIAEIRMLNPEVFSDMLHCTCPHISDVLSADQLPEHIDVIVTHVMENSAADMSREYSSQKIHQQHSGQHFWGNIVSGKMKDDALKILQMLNNASHQSLPTIEEGSRRAGILFDGELSRVWLMSTVGTKTLVYYTDFGNVQWRSTYELLNLPQMFWTIPPIARSFRLTDSNKGFDLRSQIQQQICLRIVSQEGSSLIAVAFSPHS